MNWTMIDPIIENAIREDLGSGDVTTAGIGLLGQICQGRFVAKEDGVVCGLEVARRVFLHVDRMCGEEVPILMELLTTDGSAVCKGEVLATIQGPAVPILSGERVALNFLQHLSGIATRTADAVSRIRDTQARIVDTRKTTPGLRGMEKYAVRAGGGTNHRFNLSDGVLIKDNHIAAAGGITAAVAAIRRYAPHTLRIEVEVESLEQVAEALDAGADILLLDN
ncbi:MAG: carboxylating nicotinate-nucleotide diphosphorylase, partial [Clostridiaceae bacterium]|nr:carboxylating nicotinate-nucleotide diphosphorylase [Clostridiaceae bacterium]